MTTIHPHLNAKYEEIADFCRKWSVRELALFGSVVRDDFDPESDVDVLVKFTDDARPSLWDFVDMEQELVRILGRPVDLVEQNTISNPFRRRSIEHDRTVIYAA